MNETRIEYDDTEALKQVLIGRKIISKAEVSEGNLDVIAFTLDDGTILKAHETDGGCSCSNGCFSVENPGIDFGTIMNVEIEEEGDDYQATIRLFVYDDLGKHTLIESEGGDNGYYGWGYNITVERPEVSL